MQVGRVLLLKDKVDFLGNLVLKPHPSLQSIRKKKNGLRGYRRERERDRGNNLFPANDDADTVENTFH